MAKTVVTSTATVVKVVFNDDAPAVGMTQAYFCRSNISEVRNISAGSVRVVLLTGASFSVSTNGAGGTLTVDSVDGVAPSSNIDLCDKIGALIT